VADREEHRQQQAPQRRAYGEVQGEVVRGPDPVAEATRGHDAYGEGRAGDDGVRHELLCVDQHAQQRHQSDREPGHRQRQGDELQRRSRVCAHDPRGGRRGQHQGSGDVRPSRHERTIHRMAGRRGTAAPGAGGIAGSLKQKGRVTERLHRVWQYWLQARTIPAAAVSSASLVALRAVALASEVCWARSASASAMLTCKLFAGLHAPYGGLVLRVGAGLSFAPVGPRVMQGFHWEQGPW